MVVALLCVVKGSAESICRAGVRRFMRGYSQVTVAYNSIKLVSHILSIRKTNR